MAQHSFSRIAGGLKLAQAQAMAVAGFSPDGEAQDDRGRLSLSSSSRLQSPLTHRASFHGRGNKYPKIFNFKLSESSCNSFKISTHFL